MIKIENFQEFGIENAIRGARLSYKSGDKSDSGYICDGLKFKLGQKDHDLLLGLSKKSDSESTFMRHMIISMDVTAPIMWWKQMDRYSVGKTQMSESTMHTLMNGPVTFDDFARDGLPERIGLKIPVEQEDKDFEYIYESILAHSIDALNGIISIYKQFKNKNFDDPHKEEKLKQLERMVELMLPESYLQKRTITMNYTVFRHIYYDRYYKPHKMLEWRQFCEQMLDKLSYVEFIDEKVKLAEERNDLLSKLGELNIEKFHLEREVKKINEKLNEGAEG